MTAVEWLVEQLDLNVFESDEEVDGIIEQAIKMEKEQIKKEREEAYDNGFANGQKYAYTE